GRSCGPACLSGTGRSDGVASESARGRRSWQTIDDPGRGWCVLLDGVDSGERLLTERVRDGGRTSGLLGGLLALRAHDVREVLLDELDGCALGVLGARDEVRDEHDRVDTGCGRVALERHGEVELAATLLEGRGVDDGGCGLGRVRNVL